MTALDPDSDPVFLARKGYYRKPAVAALATPPKQPMALIAAEHTAQLNAPQNEDTFSKAEENELLFQDVELVWEPRGRRATAIDVLSSTTTMEVGIDLGALSGVALRNMPPARANYQQRAGRRGNAIATVVAFGSADSHDEHYFSEPDGMIRGAVVDPKLTLDNKDIVRRHILAFLLQNYHQARLPNIEETKRHDLFSVLGTVSEFCSGAGILNRDNFAAWLTENEEVLRDRVDSWIPNELSPEDRDDLLINMREDCLGAIDNAIGFVPKGEQGSNGENESIKDESEGIPEIGDERQKLNISTLLDRLLYCGKLPRYAFPTDVAAFHIFDRDRSTPFRPIMRFAPQQGLPIALSQYAPGKQVWIAGKRYTSGAIYSVMKDERFNAWEARRRYLECEKCGFARTEDIEKIAQGDIQNCPACLSQGTFGPARNWMRPPGFAHPEDLDELTSPDEIPETSYATRAKLTMESPLENQGWLPVNDRIRVFSVRQHLLVSNTGPRNEGYSYCTKCGRIEAATAPKSTLSGSHRKPFPARDTEKNCEGGGLTRHLVLGTDFITDIALFSMRVESPIRLTPGDYRTDVALRTLSEALAKAACKLLEIEPGELMAEYRPALTQPGAEGLEAEIFLYDTLPGGAGFASQLPERGAELFQLALALMKTCPEDCDTSCYRCLRSFKNKFEHALLDRHVGAELLEYLVTGDLLPFDDRRLRNAIKLLHDDIERNGDNLVVEDNVSMDVPGAGKFTDPIYISRADGAKFAVIVSGPLEIDYPVDPIVDVAQGNPDILKIIHINELAIRGNLADATNDVLTKVRGPNFSHSLRSGT
uniref:Helicase conserved C-terminal domain-containing protein n=1 Tax=Candidatus Kentrum sp. FW TaxID=2126338 RepID=A0A450U092_9GAMM|nr:MAG: Helicase conserved C-terminal domain-containing protein [Candidatus Kentron sp. FW]